MDRDVLSRRVGISGERGRRISVGAVLSGTRPLLHLRIREGSGNRSKKPDAIDLTVSQADALMSALRAAIETVETNPFLDDDGLMGEPSEE